MDRSSIVPVLSTLLLLELPCLAIAIDIFVRNLLPQAVPALIILLDAGSIISMVFCVCTDPGILPQNINNYEWNQQLFQLPSINHTMKLDQNFLVVGIYGLAVHQKYCVECHIYRPLRAIHCRTCNHCVERYDHHCPWLGVCIGKYNYSHFLVFLVFLCLLTLMITGAALAVVIDTTRSDSSLLHCLLEIIIGLVAIGFGLGLIRLFIYHMELTHSRLTTNQDLKQTYKPISGKVPFQRCQEAHPPLFDLKAKLIRMSQCQMSASENGRNSVGKGKRYSTLVSDRQSVLNSLVDAPL